MLLGEEPGILELVEQFLSKEIKASQKGKEPVQNPIKTKCSCSSVFSFGIAMLRRGLFTEGAMLLHASSTQALQKVRSLGFLLDFHSKEKCKHEWSGLSRIRQASPGCRVSALISGMC